MSRIRSARLGGLCALAALLAAAAGAAPAHAEGGFEQVARSTGVAGATPLTVDGPYVDANAISNDGRYAYYTFTVDHGSWSTAQGIYRRDLLTNTTTQIAPGKTVRFTGITADSATISFTTKDKLSPDDKNSVADLYTYTAATGAITLVSRASGAAGLATGVGSTGYVTRDGKSALWGSLTPNVMKRSLATGTTAPLAGTTGEGLGGYPQVALRPDQGSSADGSVFEASTTSGIVIVTPTKQIPEPADMFRPIVNSQGTTAVGVSNDAPNQLIVINLVSGAVSRVDISATVPDGGVPAGFSADGSKLLFWRLHYATPDEDLVQIDLGSGVATTRGLTVYAFGPISENAQFALAGGGYATAATGSALPGGVDPPSPGAYFTMTRGCRGGFLTSTTAPWLSIDFDDFQVLPRITSATITTWSGTNPKPTVTTVTSSASFKLYVGVTPYKLQVDAKLADGRTITETWSEASETRQCQLIL